MLHLSEATNIFTVAITPLNLGNETRCGNNAAIELGLATLHQKGIVPCWRIVFSEKRVYETHAAVALRWKTNEYAIRSYVLNLYLVNFDSVNVVVAAAV